MLARTGRWQPGQSGNPKGRPSIKGPVEMLAREHTEEAVRTLVDLMRHGEPDAVRGAAANALLNRGWGMPRHVVEPVEKRVERMTLEEVEAKLAEIEAKKLIAAEQGIDDQGDDEDFG